MPETKNDGRSPIHSKCFGVTPCAGTMQLGIASANTSKTIAAFATVLATTKRLGESGGMVA
jgi:hypothetical protein